MLKVSDYRYGNNEYLWARKSGVLDKLESVCGTDIKNLVLSYLSDSHAPVLYYWNAFCDDTIPEDVKTKLRSEVDECINYTCIEKANTNIKSDFWDIKIQTNTLDDIKSQPITKLVAWIYKSKKREDLYIPAAIYEERGDIKTLITGFYQASTNKFIEATCDGILPSLFCVMPGELIITFNKLHYIVTSNALCVYKKKYYTENESRPWYIRMINPGIDSICLSDLHMINAVIHNNPFYIQKTNIKNISYSYHLFNENKQLILVQYGDNTLTIGTILPQKLDDLTPDLTNKIYSYVYYKFIDGRFHRDLKRVDNNKSKIFERIYYKVDLTNPTDDPPPIIEITFTGIKNNSYINKRIAVYYKDVKYLFTTDNLNMKVDETTIIPIDDTCNFVIAWNAAGYYDPPVVQRRT
jgi:hypothetical protein